MVEIAPVIEGRLLDEGLVLRLLFYYRAGEHLENAAAAQRGKVDREHGGVVRRQPRQLRFGREVPRLEVNYGADRAQQYGENGTDEQSAFHRVGLRQWPSGKFAPDPTEPPERRLRAE